MSVVFADVAVCEVAFVVLEAVLVSCANAEEGITAVATSSKGATSIHFWKFTLFGNRQEVFVCFGILLFKNFCIYKLKKYTISLNI